MNSGGYEPGSSPVHRARAGLKLLVLLLITATVFAVRSPFCLGGIGLAVLGGYALARVPVRRSWRALRAIGTVALVLFAFQSWLQGWLTALVVCLRLVATLAAANLFTITTRVEDLVAAIERAARPLCRFGVRPERLGLLAGLTVRAVTALSAIAEEVREAAKARGAERSVTGFAVPFLVRTLNHSDELGEALAARGEGEV
ncbi:energy-coupling factor transporter transmembrane component T [Amycolatopsis cynarae]|uniref:Energy-coupling factor transporter transmembrane component T n=1 Tax=Amycolatopsis cynarae TaxID=2995223 RepID=A0ABY7BG22_9PSEU|nr:energy-coupling factor transporter transmembrane component T [Amycolatopsis sp. HUAS 11-8]WAL69548.1 energy-coupling factor transporter transmembrane component T [Amycolatopsis sp. HUAS 11-8]